MTRTTGLVSALALVSLLGGCAEKGFDLDLRGKIGGTVDTSEAALKAAQKRQKPDARGVISYPTYKVAIARRGDSVATLAQRIGVSPTELASFNSLKVNDQLNGGQVLALPKDSYQGGSTSSAIQPAEEVSVASLAGQAIDAAPQTPANAITKTPGGVEPIRHKVERGETAFTIARSYDVSPRALAEWNGLDKNFAVKEGQYLLIPAVQNTAAATAPKVSDPGAGSATPRPPSAKRPLPAPVAPAVSAAAAAKPAKPVADIGQKQSTSNARMIMPVDGSIIREFAKGKNEGIDISAAAGTPVKAAASGKVASISATAEGVKFLLVRHPGDLITVYTHVDDISVKKGDAVSRGQSIARVKSGSPSFLHFEVRKGFESTDPMPYLR
jgi:murein DD-endopeptidase MepM/ murein hydrolase activator NlpD